MISDELIDRLGFIERKASELRQIVETNDEEKLLKAVLMIYNGDFDMLLSVGRNLVINIIGHLLNQWLENTNYRCIFDKQDNIYKIDRYNDLVLEPIAIHKTIEVKTFNPKLSVSLRSQFIKPLGWGTDFNDLIVFYEELKQWDQQGRPQNKKYNKLVKEAGDIDILLQKNELLYQWIQLTRKEILQVIDILKPHGFISLIEGLV